MMEEEFISVGETIWYESDLQLAAEIGKTLLERNKELETQLHHAQRHLTDKSAEIEFLNHQLETLRDLNESRVKVFDEVEKHATETEKVNNRLAKELTTEKEKCDRLTRNLEILEERAAELENSLQEMKNTERQRAQRESRVRTSSVPSITDALKYDNFWPVDIHELTGYKKLQKNPYESEIIRLQQTVKHLKAQKAVEDRKRTDLESEMSSIVEENNELQYKLRDYGQMKKRVLSLEMEVDELHKTARNKFNTEIENSEAINRTNVDPTAEMIAEHDDPQTNSAELLKLKNGGSAYGSRESLNKAGLQSHDSPNSQAAFLPGESLLSELNAQYMFLVRKYEAMLEAKRNSTVSTATDAEPKPTLASTESQASTVTSHRECQTSRNFQLEYNLEKKTKSFDYDKDPPEYRKIFKEIFETLRKTSAICEEK